MPENQLSNTTYVGRQAIYDSQLEVVAYELLYRNSEQNFADIGDHNRATAELLSNVFTSIGLDALVGGKSAFVNMPKDYLLGDYPMPQIEAKMVIEILEQVQPEPEVIAALTALKAEGFTLALDDYIFDEHLEPFLNIADIIKLDVMALGIEKLEEKIVELRPYNRKLLAEKVETEAEFLLCQRLGFDYFQGYYFCRPQIITGRKLEGNQLALLELMQKLAQPDISVEELSGLVELDIALSYRLLRYVNSALYGFQREISSIREAVVMLGLDALIRLVNMIVVSGFGNDRQDICLATLQRGRMCEEIAIRMGRAKDAPTYFMAGIFSNLDALLGIPLKELVEQLPLSMDVKLALTTHQGELGELLHAVTLYEQGDYLGMQTSGADLQMIVDCYLVAVRWADQAMQNVRGSEQAQAA